MRTINMIMACLLFCCFTGCAQTSVTSPLLSGPWLITLTTRDAGRLRTVMTFETDEQKTKDTLRFHAWSEKNMDRKILGNIKASLGRMAGSNFKDGSLIRIIKGKFIHQDSLIGVLVTPFGNYYIHLSLNNGHILGTLNDGNHSFVGTVEGSKGQPGMPLCNYPKIADSSLKIAEAKLYDPALLKTAAWQNFKKEIKHVSTITGDDAALVMAFFYYGRKLPFSHVALYVPAAADTEFLVEDNDPVLLEKSPETAYLKISSFGGTAGPMDKVFEKIDAKGYGNLIVDLRGNQGGSIEAGMAFARHLLKDTLYVGVLLTQQYFRTHDAPPMPKDYRSFPEFSSANYNLLLKGISEYPGICLKGFPQSPVFKGNVYVLTDEATASTCEPIVYSMKQYHLATVIGQKTAGAMLNGESFSVGHGYMITIPTATYYASDGFKIDQQGVVPDIVLKEEDALDYVLTQIKRAQKHE